MSVGQDGSVLFWLLDETKNNACLNVHEAEVPEELLQKHGVSESHLIPLKQIICVTLFDMSTLYIYMQFLVYKHKVSRHY